MSSNLGTSVIWNWSNRAEPGTLYTPALDCYLLTFDVENVAYVHAGSCHSCAVARGLQTAP